MDYNEKGNHQNSKQVLFQCRSCSSYLLSLHSCNNHSKRCPSNNKGSSITNTASICYLNFQLVSFPVPKLTLSRFDSEHNLSPIPPNQADPIEIIIQPEINLEGTTNLIKEEPTNHIIYNEEHFGKDEEEAFGWHIKEENENPDRDDCFNEYNQSFVTESDNLSSHADSLDNAGHIKDDDRLARKREQNRRAAWHYRLKTQIEIDTLFYQAAELEENKKVLEMKREELSKEIRIVKNLLLEKLHEKQERRHHNLVIVEEPDRFDNIPSLIPISSNLATSSIIIQTPEPIILPKNRKQKQGKRTKGDRNNISIELNGDLDEKTKKREMNKIAVYQHRQRKREEMNLIKNEIDFLERANTELEEKRNDLRKQINWVKNLIREKIRNKKKLKGIHLKVLNVSRSSDKTLNYVKKERI